MRKLKMSNRSKVALDKSIEHWEDVKENNSLVGPHHCDLCTLYLYKKYDLACKGCPVYKKSGATSCKDTPYYSYVDTYYEKSEYTRKKLAQKEIDFLKSCYY